MCCQLSDYHYNVHIVFYKSYLCMMEYQYKIMAPIRFGALDLDQQRQEVPVCLHYHTSSALSQVALLIVTNPTILITYNVDLPAYAVLSPLQCTYCVLQCLIYA